VHRRTLADEPQQEYFLYVPRTCDSDSRLFVAVHGISRNALEVATLFVPYAEEHGVVIVAPLFDEDRHPDYQRLGRTGRGPRADLLLDAIAEEVGCLTPASTSQFYLFGYSGGAQFAHRYSMAYPHRVIAAVIAASGWYTFPTLRKRFPYGILPIPDLPGVRFDPEEFLTVPFLVLVGDQDTTAEGLRRRRKVNRQQGRTRIERASRWVAAMKKAARRKYRLEPRISLSLIAGGGHSFADLMRQCAMGDMVFAAFFGEHEPSRRRSVSMHEGNAHGTA
jgi:poly(3-hydroxybutyrate) depolymerase